MASQKAERLRIEMDVFKFILRLEIISVDGLAIDNRKCKLCKKPYGRRFLVQGPEMACELPCGCTVGHMCIREYWSLHEMAQISCPVVSTHSFCYPINNIVPRESPHRTRDANFAMVQCQKQTPELVEDSTALARLNPLFSRHEPSDSARGYSPDSKIGAVEEEDEKKLLIEQFENDTGLHFLSHDGSLESNAFEGFSAELCHWSEDATSERILTAGDQDEEPSKEVASVESGSPSASSIISSDKGRSRKGSISRVWGIGRAAVKVVDIFPGESGWLMT
ncbi:hypothetical protein OEA41_000345 [Lepraria neglecta]|uniref:Uncharacterized protein n=1 Tax=Lepraria neglecta TaxID=209136 RepID=A0AAE0DPQ1_9LECA|nr:hypothetical protein OEA41_000345 [Lepraria neglecta]